MLQMVLLAGNLIFVCKMAIQLTVNTAVSNTPFEKNYGLKVLQTNYIKAFLVDIRVPQCPREALSYSDILTKCINWDHVVSRKLNIPELEIVVIFAEKYQVVLFSVQEKTVSGTMMRLKALRQCLPWTRKVFT